MRLLLAALAAALIAAVCAGSWGTSPARAAGPDPQAAFAAFMKAGNRNDVNAWCRGLTLKAHKLTLAQCAAYEHANGGTPTVKVVKVDHVQVAGSVVLLRVRLDGTHFRFELRLVGGKWLVYDWKNLDAVAGVTVG